MVSLADIFAARCIIQPYVYRTPLRRSFLLSEELGADIYLKTENLQRTGSFKVRGAINRVSSLTDEEKARGTVAASSGNFAIGAAYAVHLAGGVALRLFMAERTPRSKIDKLRGYDVEIEARTTRRHMMLLSPINSGMTRCTSTLSTTHTSSRDRVLWVWRSWRTCPMWIRCWCPSAAVG